MRLVIDPSKIRLFDPETETGDLVGRSERLRRMRTTRVTVGPHPAGLEVSSESNAVGVERASCA